MAVAGHYAYVVDGNGLRVVDVMNPDAPTVVGFCDMPGSSHGVAAAGNYAHVADGGGGLRVIDVTNPAEPKEATPTATPVRTPTATATWTPTVHSRKVVR